jgi:CarboxypepD_reg-like domain/TonB-dependent Receptor Plug Domain
MKQRFLLLSIILCMHYLLPAQKQGTQVAGTLKDSITNEAVTHATVSLKGTSTRTLTDDMGNFSFIHQGSFPVVVIISFVGFESREFVMQKTGETISIPFKPSGQLNEVVVTSVTKVHSAFMEAPVSVEYVSLANIRNSPSPDPYTILGTKKGVDKTTSSFTFNTISTRGFNGSGSSRVNQFVDGMDNQAPGLNFFVGNFVGLTHLDTENMELLPGASSALYGSGGMNGTILINSKSPFKHQGLSIMASQGIMHVDKSQRDKVSPYADYSFRWAKAFNNKFAIKLGAQYIKAKDWLANDSTNYSRLGNSGKTITGTRASDPNYDGVNVYGDETKGDIRGIMVELIKQNPGLQPVLEPFLTNPQNVSRTGYAEKDIIDPVTKNTKLSGALHYRFNSRLEAVLMGYWATGNTVYTGNNRYALQGIKIGQYKLELKSPNWFIRSYTTQEDAGQAFSATVATQRFNEAWKKSLDYTNLPGSWYPQYTGAFATGAAGIFQQVYGSTGSISQAQAAVVSAAPQLHQAARGYADLGRPVAGSDQFKQIFDQVKKTPIPEGGLFLEKSQLWMTEGQYDFSNKVKFVDLIVGGNWKKYVLN